MRRRLLTSLLAILVIAFGSLAATLAVGNAPQLGLDLQGGASVVLQPPASVEDPEVLDQAIEVIRNRVDALGVAEPEITRQGDAVVVELPGVKDQQRALEVVGQTAQLQFRPVLDVIGPEAEPPPLTPREEITADAEVVVAGEREDGAEPLVYRLGPAGALGGDLKGAQAAFNQPTWAVNVEFTSEGIVRFNQLAQACFNGESTCPLRSAAIVLDEVVVSAPRIQQPEFQADQIQISGDFGEAEAKDLALVLRFGALPVQLEQQSVSTVSATLGRDSLRAGLIAGGLGTGLVLLYLVAYYRVLGLVVALGLCVWAALQWSVISFLGTSQGLALSLAGVTGIVVSVGVTVDSYIVYFERLKDEVRSGRSLRSSVDRGFKRAFRTILAADTSAFIGAFLLWWLTVGPVRGFAFFLGLSTVLDLIVAYFFTRPLVAMLARRRRLTSARLLGVAAGLGVAPSPTVASPSTVGAGR